MTQKINNELENARLKHDQFAKGCFVDKAALRAFLEIYLDEETKALCDFDRIELINTSFVDDLLNGYATDLLAKIGLKDTSVMDYMCIHLEFQSDMIKFMPTRTFIYQAEILKHIWRGNKDKSKKLPNVLTIVIYNGTQKYTASTEMAEMFASPKLYRNMPAGNFQLVNLQDTPNEELLRHGAIAAFEVIAKNAKIDKFNQDTAKTIAKALKISLDNGAQKRLIPMIFAYLVARLGKNEVKLLEEEIKLVIPNFKRIIMTYEQELLNKGERRGELRGSIKNAISFLKMGFDPKDVAKGVHLPIKKVRELEIELKDSHAKHTKH